MYRRILTAGLLALPLLALAGEKEKAAETGTYKQLDAYTPDDLSWVKRTLKKTPAYKSDKVRYTVWVLGQDRTATMVMAWDESKGPGTGYDTVYLDKNFNGDLTEEGEMLHHPIPPKTGKKAPQVAFDVSGIKDSSGKSYRMYMLMENGRYHWKSGFYTSWPNPANAKRPHSYKVGLLPGNLQIRFSNTLENAPVYRLGGGDAMVLPCTSTGRGKNRKSHTYKPGEHYGTFEAGRQASVNLTVAMCGADLNTQLRFYHSRVGGQLPRIVLRVLQDGTCKEEIPFTGGCG